MIRKSDLRAMVMGWSLLAAGTAIADEHIFTFSGTVTYVNNWGGFGFDPPWDQVEAGDPWRITYRFDADALDNSPSPTFGGYQPIHWYELTIGDATVSGAIDPTWTSINIFSGQPAGVDQYEVWLYWQEGFKAYQWFMQLDDLDGTAWDNAGLDPRDALPRCGQINLDWFGIKDFYFTDDFGWGNEIYGSVDSFTCDITPTYFDGLPHRPLGQARLTIDPDTGHLLVGNLGPSGEDGFAVLLGDNFDETGPQGLGITYKNTPNVPCWPNHLFLATTDHKVHGELHHHLTVNSYDQGDVVARLSAWIDSYVPYDELSVVVFKDGQRVHFENVAHDYEYIHILGPGCGWVTKTYFGPLPKTCNVCLSPRGWEVGLTTLDADGNQAPVTLRLPSGAVVVGDALWVHPKLFDPFEPFSIKDMAGYFKWSDDEEGIIGVADTHVGMFNAELRTRGDARFGFGSGSVTMSNLAGSGNDGLAIDVAPANSASMVVDTADPGAAASLRTTLYGAANGVPNSPLGTLSLDAEGNGTRFTPDFSELGASGYTITVYNGDDIVYSGDDPQSIIVIEIGNIRIEWDGSDPHWSDILWWAWKNGMGITPIDIDDGDEVWHVMGDRIEFAALNPPVVPESIDRVELTAADMASFTVSDFTYDPIPTCRPDVNGDGVVNTVDFIVFLNAWAGQSQDADWNGDGAINTLDFVLFLNDWAEAVLNAGWCP